MQTKSLPRIKRDDVITADYLNALVSAIERNQILTGQSSGIDATQMPGGIALRVASLGDFWIARTSSIITARIGTKYGKGTIFLQTMDDEDLIDTGRELDVVNYSGSPSTGIPSGKYCAVKQEANGRWVLVSAEC